jgi:hypothetical protein
MHVGRSAFSLEHITCYTRIALHSSLFHLVSAAAITVRFMYAFAVLVTEIVLSVGLSALQFC